MVFNANDCCVCERQKHWNLAHPFGVMLAITMKCCVCRLRQKRSVQNENTRATTHRHVQRAQASSIWFLHRVPRVLVCVREYILYRYACRCAVYVYLLCIFDLLRYRCLSTRIQNPYIYSLAYSFGYCALQCSTLASVCVQKFKYSFFDCILLKSLSCPNELTHIGQFWLRLFEIPMEMEMESSMHFCNQMMQNFS